MLRRPPRSTRTDTPFPTRLSSDLGALHHQWPNRNGGLACGSPIGNACAGVRRTTRSKAPSRHLARRNRRQAVATHSGHADHRSARGVRNDAALAPGRNKCRGWSDVTAAFQSLRMVRLRLSERTRRVSGTGGELPVTAVPRLRPAFAAKKRSEEHTSELQSLMRISSAVFCLKKKKKLHM